MKQLLVLSGKGGTGKTTVASSLIKYGKSLVYADCDVDAPNLHLILNKDRNLEVKDYYGLPRAKIDYNDCINCGQCFNHCRFNAIKNNDEKYVIDQYTCEGCGVCSHICPMGAITMKKYVSGELKQLNDDVLFSTAMLKVGSGASGKLVTEVKKQLLVGGFDDEVAILDGSPGIGCPVIASISGVDMVLIVTEPSISGISDLERIIQLTNSFNTPCVVCINKFDTNLERTNEIEDICSNNDVLVVGKIPFDKNAVKLVNEGLTLVDIEGLLKDAVIEIYDNTMKLLLG